MAVTTLYPNEDVGPNQWSNVRGAGNRWEDLDSQTDTWGILAQQENGEDNAVDVFGFTTIAGNNIVTQVDIFIRGSIAGTGSPEYDISYNGGVDWEGYRETDLGVVPIATQNPDTDGGLSLSQSDIDSIQMRFRADVPVKLDDNFIVYVYLVVTYTSAYGHDYMGVPAANIGSVSGVPSINIASIKGV